jgi:hypothetical protein
VQYHQHLLELSPEEGSSLLPQRSVLFYCFGLSIFVTMEKLLVNATYNIRVQSYLKTYMRELNKHYGCAAFFSPPLFFWKQEKLKLNSVALVRERTIPTERPPPVGEVSANFCG